jgi:hypothetical protein
MAKIKHVVHHDVVLREITAFVGYCLYHYFILGTEDQPSRLGNVFNQRIVLSDYRAYAASPGVLSSMECTGMDKSLPVPRKGAGFRSRIAQVQILPRPPFLSLSQLKI